MAKVNQEIANRLRLARIEAGYKTALEFSSKYGFKQSTYSTHEAGTRGIPRDTMLDYEEKLGKQPGYLISGVQSTGSLKVKPIEIAGVVAAGVWRETVTYDKGDPRRKQVFVPDVPEGSFALLVEGPSMNLVYPQGTILVCRTVYDLDREPNDGERVIIYRKNGSLIEATCKEYREDSDGHPWAWPRSSDPKHQEPLPLNNGQKGEEIEVYAIVIGSYRPEM